MPSTELVGLLKPLRDARAVILDLRGNDGGILSVMLDIMGPFLSEPFEMASQISRKKSEPVRVKPIWDFCRFCQSVASIRKCPIPRKASAMACLSSGDPPWSRDRIRCLSWISSSADCSRSCIVVQSVSRIAALHEWYQVKGHNLGPNFLRGGIWLLNGATPRNLKAEHF